MIYLCPTYDYELFFGKSEYSEIEVLVEPTYKLLELYKRNNIPLTLFVDTCCMQKYTQYNTSFVEAVEEQLRKALEDGNDIQLHLHPHWISAYKELDVWNINQDEYRMHAFTQERQDEIVKQGIIYLENIASSVVDNYKCIAFRAGGYCLQPEQGLLGVLYKNGIRIDSSVNRGGRSEDSTHYYNYKGISQKFGWRFDVAKGINTSVIDSRECMFEVPLGTVDSALQKLTIRPRMKKVERPQLKGKFVGSLEKKQDSSVCNKIIKKVIKFTSEAYIMEYDEWDAKSMALIMRKLLKNVDYAEKDVYFAVVGHPKVFCEELGSNTEKFYELIRKEYGNYLKIVSMRDAYDLLYNE